MSDIRRIIITGLFTALAIILHLVENIIPMSALVPGAKIGLANIANLLGLVLFGFVSGLEILLLRVLMVALLAGSFLSINFYLSLSGGLLAYLIMSFLYYYGKDRFSLLGISVAGAFFHNLAQLIIAYFIIKNTGIFYYLPYLMLLSVPSGISIGLVSYFALNYLPQGGDIYAS